MDAIIQLEVLLNLLNTVFGKAVYYKDYVMVKRLSTIRHTIYYTNDYVYESLLKELHGLDLELNKYE